jgi:tRNA A-37 threonylcarbamoyl transferase component Bud32
MEIFLRLFDLHKFGFNHGDPRKENIILYQDKLLWIDFRSMSGEVVPKDVRSLMFKRVCSIISSSCYHSSHFLSLRMFIASFIVFGICMFPSLTKPWW